ncbi:9276_t:CDS:10, partial [Acaulospora colombiana]
MVSTYDFFYELASLDPLERQASTAGFISYLHNKYEEHLKSKVNPTSNKIAKEDFTGVLDYLESSCGADITYSLVRLTRGLASPRAGARHGFSLALIELLACLKCVTYKIIATLIDEACLIKSSKDRENSDLIFGRVFGFMAIIQSGILWRESSTKENYIETIDNLIACSNYKSYVRESCYHIIISSIPHLKITSFEDSAIAHLITVMKGRNNHGIHNPDDVNLALSIESQYPEIVKNDSWKKILLHDCDSCVVKWRNPNIMHRDNMAKLAEAIQVCFEDLVISVSLVSLYPFIIAFQARSSKLAAEIHQNQESRLHSVWNTIINLYSCEDVIGKHSIKFDDFWKFVVDAHFATFQLKVIEQVSAEDGDKGMIIVKSLLGTNCNWDFDTLSGTKTIKRILRTMSSDALENFLLHVEQIFLKPNQKDNSGTDTIEDCRQWIINFVYSILKDAQMKRRESWMIIVFNMFIMYGFFTAKVDGEKKISKCDFDESSSMFDSMGEPLEKMREDFMQARFRVPKPPLSEKTQECCRTRFFHALGELITIRPLENKQSFDVRLNGTMNNGETWAYYAVCQLVKLERDEKIEPLIILNDEVRETKEKVFKIMHRINDKLRKSKEKTTKNQDEALQCEGFLWLFSFSILTLYNEQKEAMNALEDLQSCYAKMSAKSKKSIHDEHDPADVIVDILLGYLAIPSSLLHNMAEHAFRIFCGKITGSSLNLLLDLINKGDIEAMDIDSEEEVDKMEGEDEDDEESDSNASEGEDDSNEDDSGESDDDHVILKRKYKNIDEQDENESDEDDENDEDNEDNESDEGDDAVSDQERMMEDLDSKLVEYFKQKKIEKSRKKDAKYQKIHFKHKVIGLLRVFAHSQPTNPLILELLVPLLEISKNSKTDEISRSAFVLLNKIIANKEVPTQFEDGKVLTLIKQVHDLSSKSKNGELSKSCWKAGIYLFRSLALHYKDEGSDGLPEEYPNPSIEKAVNIYELSYQKWIKRPNRLTVKSFSELPNLLPQVPWYLSKIFLEFTDPETAKNPKQVTLAYDISKSIFNYYVPKKKRKL